MKNSLSLIAVSVMMTVIACSTNAITGRKQLSLVPESQLQQMAVTEYRTFLNQSRVVSSSQNKDADMVKRVGSRIASAITNYYRGRGLGNEVANYQWEYNLVQNDAANAWCMPGGKIVVYTGLLPVTQNEAALAVVVGHEVAHALAKHGSERMSQGLLQQLGGVALDVALSNKSAETRGLFNAVYGVGSQVGFALPHSRNQELEADKLGLVYTALAGYDPRQAIPLWQRMKAMSDGNRPPQFLSTHPAEDTRIAELNRHMPEALRHYKPQGKR